MANQCVTEIEIIGPEEAMRGVLRLMIDNLRANGVAKEEPPSEDARFMDMTRWITQYTGSPTCAYLEALSTNVVSRPMGWDTQLFVTGYGELFRLSIDFDTAWGPAITEVEDFINSLPSPCGIYYRPDADSRHKEIMLKENGEVEYVKLSSKFDRFKSTFGDRDVFSAQMHKAITNRLPKVK